MFITGDPHADFDRYDAEKERRLDKLPVCECCKEHIQTEDLYDFENGYLICPDCVSDWIDEHYKKRTDIYEALYREE